MTSTLALGKKNLQLSVVKPKQKGLSKKATLSEKDDQLGLETILKYKLGEVKV